MIQETTICFGTSEVNFAICGSFFMATSSASSGVQKKESSGSGFGCRDVGDVLILVREANSFMFSTSESQKKERSEMDFVHGITGDETTFLGGAIKRVTTC